MDIPLLSSTSTDSVLTIISVLLSTITTPLGCVLNMMNGRNPPISAMLGITMESPLTNGLLSRPFLKSSSTPWPNLTLFPAGIFGATVIFVANCTFALDTTTLSPIDTPAFDLTMPSIEIVPFPSSSGDARNTLAAVFLFPVISIKSPMSTPSLFLETLSILALPKPTSDWCCALSTRNVMLSGIFVSPTDKRYV